MSRPNNVVVNEGIQENVVNKFGFNPDVDTGTVPADIWTPGGVYPYSTFVTAQTLELVSLSANDTSAGTGARTVFVEGLDSVLAEQTETVTLNGLTPVAIPGTWTAINRMYIVTAGTTGKNEGSINCQISGAGAIVSQIAFRISLTASQEGKGQTEQAVYRVPANKKLQIKSIYIHLNGNTVTEAVIDLKRVCVDCITTRSSGSFFTDPDVDVHREYKAGGPVFTAGEWVSLRVMEVGVNNTVLTGEWDGVLEDVA
jgi:hypothetical protein